ncbi:MAG: hypothetical protein R2708_25105 [Vicinamibacterales bacterium]
MDDDAHEVNSSFFENLGFSYEYELCQRARPAPAHQWVAKDALSRCPTAFDPAKKLN